MDNNLLNKMVGDKYIIIAQTIPVEIGNFNGVGYSKESYRNTPCIYHPISRYKVQHPVIKYVTSSHALKGCSLRSQFFASQKTGLP